MLFTAGGAGDGSDMFPFMTPRPIKAGGGGSLLFLLHEPYGGGGRPVFQTPKLISVAAKERYPKKSETEKNSFITYLSLYRVSTHLYHKV